MNKKIIGSILIGLLILIGYSSYNWLISDSDNLNLSDGETNIKDLYNDNFEGKNITEYNLKAVKTDWALNKSKKVDAWTFNGTVPGEPLRVKKGDVLKVNLKNELDVPVTIHWHGVILPNVMDGVPDLTQEPIQPGESFTYQFVARHPGTYWYHSHQQSSLQVDKGLYGSLIVEENTRKKSYNNEQVLILDEWATDGERESITNMPGMMMGSMAGDGEADTKQMYDTYTVNGKTGKSIKPVVIGKNDKARLRIINAGYQVHRLKFPKGTVEVIAYDASNVFNQKNGINVIEIAPGERVDLKVTNNKTEPWFITDDTGSGTSNVNIPVLSKKNMNYTHQQIKQKSKMNKVDGSTLGSKELIFNETPKNPDVTYNMDLSMGMNMSEGMVFQINNDTFPNTPPIKVEEGDIVKVEINNNGRLNHPMHLHGHRFQIMSKNGSTYKNPMVKDLINVKPGESYTIYFKANNKGEWLFHCHDNNHADRGMITVVDYQSVYSPFNK